MVTVYIGLGSNKGDRAKNVEEALAALRSNPDIELLRVSTVRETEPAGVSEPEKFLNCVAEIRTGLSSHNLLAFCMRTERRLGRIRRVKWGPRTIDLDILLYGGRVVRTDALSVPHPLMQFREFVLEPLAELAPDLVHPVLKKTIAELLEECRGREGDAEFRRPDVVEDIALMQRLADGWRKSGKTIGLVPTMGYLHEGHLSLIRAARAECDLVVATIFVNPAQFAEGEDYDRYPQDFEGDLDKCGYAGVNVVFTAARDEMYPEDFSTWIDNDALTYQLCARERPGHFRGVATVVAKLFNITKPHKAYFGQKDAQQAKILKRMAKDLNFDIEVNVLPIVREESGLALSSRNKYLSEAEKADALVLKRSLDAAAEMIEAGERDPAVVAAEMEKIISAPGTVELAYIEIVGADNLLDMEKLAGRILIAVAARVGPARLIDNVEIDVPDA